MPADAIELRGLVAMGVCGALPEEERSQPLEIDLDVELDAARAVATDALEDTLDYAALCDLIERIVATERFNLLEALAGRVCDAVLKDDRARQVTIHVRKLRPPVPHQLRTAGVRLTRSRA